MSIVQKIVSFIRNHIPWLALLINRIATNKLSQSTEPRPHTYSLWSPEGKGSPSRYLTWHSVTDKRYFDMHHQPATQDYVDSLPSNAPTDEFPFGEVTDLFARNDNFTEGRSSVFFMFFAQWFTDGFFRSSYHNDRQTTTNHNIDLAQIYGADEDISLILRSRSGGRLTSQMIDGEEYPDYLGELDENGEWKVKDKYLDLPYIKDEKIRAEFIDIVKKQNKPYLFATGLERVNAIVGNICFTTLFLREHNNICKALEKEYPDWDDDRLFHTARIINTVVLMKLVIEDYVNHIAGLDLLIMDQSFVEKQEWYRTPWIAAEFNLLYRWHSLIPDNLQLDGESQVLVANYNLLETKGLESIFQAAADQTAGKIKLGNVPNFMLPVERTTIEKGREWCLPSFNEYRKKFGLDPLKSFDEFTDDTEIQAKLKALYGTPDKVELTVGLFAEESTGITITGELLTTMVAYDAVTQIYTNPLLAKTNYTEQHFTPVGMKWIEGTKTFQDLVSRNTSKKISVGLAV